MFLLEVDVADDEDVTNDVVDEAGMLVEAEAEEEDAG